MSLDAIIGAVSPDVAGILGRSLEGREMSEDELGRLLTATGPDFHALLAAADHRRREIAGDDVTFVVCRNINFTNVCYVGCSFCGFARHKDDAEEAFDHSMDVILEKCRDAVARGATEVCIQGGIHPGKNHEHYREILTTIKSAFPDLHIHAYSPEEIDFGHRKSGMPLDEYLQWLVDAGLGTMPGTAAEILDDEIRDVLSLLSENASQLVDQIQAQRELVDAENCDLLVREAEIHPVKFLDHLVRSYEGNSLAKGKVIRIEPGSADSPFRADRTLLRRVTDNMLKNALESSSVGQMVTVGCSEQAGRIRFFVHNETAMPEDVQLQVFNRSFSTKGPGRGIGTYSMKMLSERYMGGIVGFTSNKAEGTTFWAEYPLNPPHKAVSTVSSGFASSGMDRPETARG